MSKDNPRLDFVSLFSGAGGLDLGLEYAGWHCLYAADNEPSAVAALKRNQQAGFAAHAVIEVAGVRDLTGAKALGGELTKSVQSGRPPARRRPQALSSNCPSPSPKPSNTR